MIAEIPRLRSSVALLLPGSRSEAPLLRRHKVSLSDIATLLRRNEAPLRRRLYYTRCIAPVPFAVAACEVTPVVFEAAFDWTRRLHVRPVHWRRPYASIHHHFM